MMRPLPTSPPPTPIAFSVLFERVLVGAFAALVVARPMAAGNDPGRLQLTSGTGAISFNLCVFLVLFACCLWRALDRRGRPIRIAIVPLLLAVVAILAWVSSQMGERYARPGLFIAWEWGALAATVLLTRQLIGTVGDRSGILNVLVATAVCVAGLGIYQSVENRLGLPALSVVVPPDAPVLAGDEEFYPELNRLPVAAPIPRGTFDSAETFLVFLILVLPLAVAVYRSRHGSPWARWSIAVPGILIAGAIAALLARPFSASMESWSAAMNLILAFPLFGTGPGNFSRFAPEVLSPQSFVLGLAATTGLIALAAVLAAVAYLLFRAFRTDPPETADRPSPGTRWEFYLGGVGGLLLGFVWTVGETPAEAPPGEIFKLGAAAVFRAMIWFASFALLETIRPAPRALIRAAVTGAVLVLLLGFISDAVSRPTILFPLLVMLTLGSGSRTATSLASGGDQWHRPLFVTAAIAVAALTIAYLVTAAVPAWSTASAVRQVRMASRHYPNLHRQIELARPGAPRANAMSAARNFLVASLVNPLAEAAHRDPTNASLLLEVARWRRPLWEYELLIDRENAARVADETRKLAELADHLDPRNRAARRNLFEAMLLFRRYSTVKEPERLAALNKLIGQIAEREPGLEVPLRYRVVQMLLDRGDAEGAESEIARLFALNRVEGSPHGQMSEIQKSDLIEKAKKVLRVLPPALLEEWTR